ncbi:MAG TPA: hypothetical protein VJB82_03540 [Candidatus Peribacterales bacterium]|nr:hypothetical protein [Candidatus Peribacterales bacterium]
MRPTFLIWHWSKIAKQVLEPLKFAAPNPDTFVEMLRNSQSIIHNIDPAFLSDNDKALEYLSSFDAKEYELSERDCIALVEAWDDALQHISPPRAANFRLLMRQFFKNNVIRYVVDDGKIGYEPALLMAEAVMKLKMQCHSDPAAKRTFEKFEKRFSRLLVFSDDPEVVLGAASNLLERCCKKRAGRGRTLKQASEHLGLALPHKDTNESMCHLYDFFSDYSDVRHDGTPENALRDLTAHDALVFSAIALMFSSMLSDGGYSLFD